MSYRQLSMHIVLCLDKTPQALDRWIFTFFTWVFQLNLLSRRTPRYFKMSLWEMIWWLIVT